ncbi:MAG: VWA domain-containing protein [Planctomycetaceae bacterium]|nr:VWA domain-containing protein [Planctomycetaceae bacterium]
MLAIVCLLAAMTFVGMSVDLGMITVTKTRMQSAADSAALAAAQEIVVGIRNAGQQGTTDIAAVQAIAAAAARTMAENVAAMNGFYLDPETDVTLGRRVLGSDGVSYTEVWNEPPYNMVKVEIRKTNDDASQPDAKLPLIFAGAAGNRTQSVTADAVAFIESRDIVATLDYSGSMAFDSLLMAATVSRLTKPTVESGLDDIWQALVDSEATFSDDPDTLKFPSTGFGGINSAAGVTNNSSNADTVLEDLGLYTPAENYWDSWSYSGSGDYHYTSSKVGGYYWRKYDSGTLKRRSSTYDSWSTVADTTYPYYEPSTPEEYVPFPQEGRSTSTGDLLGKPNATTSKSLWKGYINYVIGDSDLNGQGYRKKYGYRTLMNYLVDMRKSNSQSEDLWRAPIYPHHALKEGVSTLADFLNNLGYGDHLGLVTYATTARIETGLNDDGVEDTVDLGDEYLTENVTGIDTIQRHRQPGHYDSSTGIGYGLERAKELLDDQGRYGAQKAILLMTDGQSNQYPSGYGSSSLPSGWNWNDITDFDGDGTADFVIDSNYSGGGNGDGNWRAALHSFVKAKEAVDAGYIIHAISLGDGADTSLMSAIAELSGGEYVHIASGTSTEDMESSLRAAFSVLAGQVPPARLIMEED